MDDLFCRTRPGLRGFVLRAGFAGIADGLVAIFTLGFYHSGFSVRSSRKMIDFMYGDK